MAFLAHEKETKYLREFLEQGVHLSLIKSQSDSVGIKLRGRRTLHLDRLDWTGRANVLISSVTIINNQYHLLTPRLQKLPEGWIGSFSVGHMLAIVVVLRQYERILHTEINSIPRCV